MSYSSIVPCTAVVRVQARLMIFTICGVIYGVIYGVIVGSRIRVARNALAKLPSCVNGESTTREIINLA